MRPNKENSIILIPARAGSKGVPNKNSKPFANEKSLVERAIEVALSEFPKEKIILSTDDETLWKQAEKSGITILKRDEHLASDKAGMLEVMLDVIDKQAVKPTFLILFQPTSPFRTKEHLKEALNLFQEGDQALVSVNEPKGHPFYTLFQQEGEFINKFQKNTIVRRQDLPAMYDVNGLIYIFEIESLRKESWVNFERIRPMPVSLFDAIDIDTEEDWFFAETLEKGLKTNI